MSRWRFMLLALVLLGVMGLTVSPAWAAVPTITASPADGVAVGEPIALIGWGFAPGSIVTITFNGEKMVTDPPVVVAVSGGGWTATIWAPPNIEAGAVNRIKAAGGSVSAYIDDYAGLLGICVTRVPYPNDITPNGKVGEAILVYGSGFGASESPITVTYDAIPVVGSFSADSYGRWQSTFVVPEGVAGPEMHNVRAVGPLSTSPTSSFTVKPSASLGATSGARGERVAISGQGFLGKSRVEVRFDDASAVTAPYPLISDDVGSFSGAVTVPVGATFGLNTIVIRTSDVAWATTLRVTGIAASLQAMPAAGGTVEVTGLHFTPSSPVTITWDGAPAPLVSVPVGTAAATTGRLTCDELGNFQCYFAVPGDAADGEHAITATSSGETPKSASAVVTITDGLVSVSGGISSPLLVGEKGPQGDKGPAGDRGPLGDKGPRGDKGPPGDPGHVGMLMPIAAMVLAVIAVVAVFIRKW